MKKNSLFLLLIVFFASCSKQNEPQPLADRVAGTWKVTSIDDDPLKSSDKVSFTFTKKTSTSVHGLFEINTTELDMETINLSDSDSDVNLESEEGLGWGTVSGNKMTFWLELSGDIYELKATKQ